MKATILIALFSVVMMVVGCVTGKDYPFCHRVTGHIVKEEEQIRWENGAMRSLWFQYLETEEKDLFIIPFKSDETRYQIGTYLVNVLIIER